MKALVQAMLREGYAMTEEYPELADSATRDEIQTFVEAFDGRLSYDPTNGTGTILLASDEDTYTMLERATMFICWAHFIHRREAYRSQPQRERVGVLTEEKADELRAHKRYTVKAQQLAADFPNLFPEARHASGVLNSLEQKKVVVREGDSFAAGPLLAHLINEQDARALIDGELRGHFENFKPSETLSGALRPRILDQLRLLERGEARRKILIERLGADWKTIRFELDRLMDEGIVDHEGAGPATFYYIREESTGGSP